jgi:transposase
MVTTNKNALGTLLEKRKKVIELISKGMRKMEIVKQVKLSWPAVQKTISLYEEGGNDSLKPPPRGRHKGVGRVLSPEQEAEILTIICNYRPSRYAKNHLKNSGTEWNQGLWNRQLVKLLITQLTGITLSASAITQYVERWGFLIPNRDPIDTYPWSKENRRWWQDHSKKLLETMQSQQAQLFFLNKRRTPVALPEGSKKGWVINVINRKGEQCWWVCSGMFSYKQQRQLLSALLKNQRKKICAIIPNATFFNSGKLQSYLEKHAKRLEIYPPMENITKNVCQLDEPL